MSRFTNNQITKAGLNLLAKSQVGIPIVYTKILLGDGFLNSEQDIRYIDNVVNEIASISITKCIIEDGRAVVGGPFPYEILRTGFYYRELALFAIDPDLGEILYSYSNAGDQAEWIPPANDADLTERFIEIVTSVSNTTNISAYIDSGMYATIDMLNFYVNQLKPISWNAGEIVDENTSETYDASANDVQVALLNAASKFVNGVTVSRKILFGEYVAVFRIKTNSIQSSENVIACEIMSSANDAPIVSRLISPSEFQEIDKWIYFKVPFESNNINNADMLVYPKVRYLSGSAEIKVDNIIIVPDI